MLRVLLLVPLLAACASTLPPDPVERALYIDTLTLIRSQTRSEWTIDRLALDNIGPGLAWSGCQVAPDKRASLIAWLDTEISKETNRIGGDAETVWRTNDKDLGAVQDLLELNRARMAIAGLHARAPTECPFWLEADPDFIGMQGDANRFVLFVESRGQLALNVRADSARFAGGGGGRILVGGGLSDRVTLMTGFELGGGGRFGEDGGLSGVLYGALPVLLRLPDAGSALDLELAAVTFLQGSNGWPPGFRAAIAYGFVTPRVGGAFSPQAMFWFGYEYHPRRGPEEPFHVIGIGTRIGVAIDP